MLEDVLDDNRKQREAQLQTSAEISHLKLLLSLQNGREMTPPRDSPRQKTVPDRLGGLRSGNLPPQTEAPPGSY